WHKIDNGQWVKLTKNREWWKGAIDGSALKPGLHTLTVKGIENNTREIVRKVNIIKCRNEKDARPPVNIKLMTDKPSYKNGDEIKIEAHFTDREGAPLKNHYVKLGALNSVNSYSMRWEGYTDDKGFFSKAVPALGEFNEWYYIFWAGAEMEDYGYKTKEGKISYVKTIAGEGFPVKWLTAKKAEGITIDGIIENAWSGTDKIEITADTNFAEGSVKNSGDLSAEARVLWDESNIYLLACVKDNVPMKNEYEKLDLWKGDCVELFISVDPAKIPEAGYSGFDFQILIGTNGKMWIPGQRTGGVRNNIPVSSKAAARKNSEGYTLEAKINLANFGNVPLKFFSRDNILGFDIAVGDADESGMRDAKLIWNGTGAGYKNSAVWGRLKLEL
ncbi:MAG: sugar-binding protein, partial [Candidatus Omnitrophota bacterium]|nr:sugar-binding protein [Candidatus Omnitrophota bacterium]